MELIKAHGTGNDFVVVPDPEGRLDLTAEAVVALCDRRTGIGADGLLRLGPSADGDVFMDYRNGGDGAAVEMCGNGVRVVAAHLVDHGWVGGPDVAVETRDGVKRTTVQVGSDGRVANVTVDMGPPAFDADALPFVPGDRNGAFDLVAAGGELHQLLTVSMGNPHAVLLVDDPDSAPVTTLGPVLETDPRFPRGTNVEFVQLVGDDHVRVRVWERGVGETMACGTGACGVVAALTKAGHVAAGTQVGVELPGGTLRVRWAGTATDPVWMTGAVEEVAHVRLTEQWMLRAGLASLIDHPAGSTS